MLFHSFGDQILRAFSVRVKRQKNRIGEYLGKIRLGVGQLNTEDKIPSSLYAKFLDGQGSVNLLAFARRNKSGARGEAV